MALSLIHILYNSLHQAVSLLSLPCLHRLPPVNGFHNSVHSSASVFTPLSATDCLRDPHGGDSWPLTPSRVWPPLATTRYRKLALTVSATNSKSKSKLCYDRRLVGQSILVSKPPSEAQDQTFTTVRQLRVC
jgi:hypothetical protein